MSILPAVDIVNIGIEDIIKESGVFNGGPAKYELLNGGFVNKNYKVEHDGKLYCVRINNVRQMPYFGLDAKAEAQVCQQASILSISPKIYNPDNAEYYLISDYFVGKCLSNEDARNPEIIEKYVGAIRLIHENIKSDRVFSIYDQFDKYLKAAEICKIKIPENTDKVMGEVEKIKQMRIDSGCLYNVFCHNDIWQNNILYDGEKVCIIDWEYCGYGDGFFDFAHIVNASGMTDEEQKFLLKSYFGYYEPEMGETLNRMKFISDVYCVIWYIFHACITQDENQKVGFLNNAENGIKRLAGII